MSDPAANGIQIKQAVKCDSMASVKAAPYVNPRKNDRPFPSSLVIHRARAAHASIDPSNAPEYPRASDEK